MPTYDYGCNQCGFLWQDVVQNINDPPKKKCPRCAKHTLERVIYGGAHVFIRGEATTLGQLAEQNSKRLGKYGVEEKEAKKNKQVKEGLKQHKEGIKQINKMSESQKQRYIDNG